ncbi:hypothetical protein VP06_30235 [Methylobacterium aquaticum]|uniref:Uncharacterized protein n=1 Tax=Methylobacterium aquaticum TaxID=270351 RepID=A0A0J6S232_9HYPH|nr:hypothetical protein VP06_30235 [Methylobacterium aquaticum]
MVSVVAVAPVVMAPAVVVAPVPVRAVVAPAAVMVMRVVMPPAVVVRVPVRVVMVAPTAVMAAPTVVVAILHLDRPGRGCAGGTRCEGGRLHAAARDEAACHQGRHRQHPPAGPHRVEHRQHVRLRFVSPHLRAAVEGKSGARGLNTD